MPTTNRNLSSLKRLLLDMVDILTFRKEGKKLVGVREEGAEDGLEEADHWLRALLRGTASRRIINRNNVGTRQIYTSQM